MKDLLTGEVTRVSTDAAGAEADRPSSNPVFSPDGSKVAFLSAATNLVPGVADGSVGLFVKDLASGAILRVASGVSGDVAFSPDGSKLIFESGATNLVSGDTNGQDDIFVVDLASGAIARVSTTQQGEQASGRSEVAAFSPDGTKIAFSSVAANLVAGDTNGLADIFVKDLASGALQRFPSTWFGEVASSRPLFSPDGSRIAFDGGGQIFLVDLATGERTHVSTNGPQGTTGIFSLSHAFSPDGSKIAFWAWGWSGGPNVVIKDLTTGGLAVVTHPIEGDVDMVSSSFDLSWIGNMLAFSARTSGGLAPGDSAAYEYIYVRQLSIASVAPLDAVKAEGNWGEATFTFTITRSGDLSAGQSVDWGVSAVSFDGYPGIFGSSPSPSGTVDFAPGETTKTIAVQVAGDGLVEPDQSFLISLFNATEGLIFDNGPAKGVILNDDMRAHDDAFIIGPGEVLHDSTSVPDTHPRIGVLANDESTGPMTASLVTGPAHGTVVLGADGHFDYTPDPGFTGIDRFVYNASGSLAQADGQVLIHVVPELQGSIPTLNLLALTAEEQIAATYVAFFNRGADAPGFQFWLDQFHAGQATQGPAALLANIASSFAVSDEAKVLHPFLAQPDGSNYWRAYDFLHGVYSNLFGRLPDADGLAYWTGRVSETLEQGGFVGSVLIDIVSGAQNPPDGPQDITRLMGKVAVSLAYVAEQQVLGTQWTSDQLMQAREMLQGVSESTASVLMGITYAENVVLAHALASVGGH